MSCAGPRLSPDILFRLAKNSESNLQAIDCVFLEREMSTVASSHTNARGTARRGRGGRVGRNLDNQLGAGGRNTPRTNGKNADSEITPPQKENERPVPMAKAAVEETASEDNDAAICWICAEPVKYYSISECNHRTCHVCALRLRALYKKTDCTFCKVRVASFNEFWFEFFATQGTSINCYLYNVRRR